MKKIFVEDDDLYAGKILHITDADYNHLAKALRVKTGETFVIQGEATGEFSGEVVSITKKLIEINLREELPGKNDSNYIEKVLFFPLLKGSKNETILKFCTEIGVDRFIPVITANSIIKIENSNESKKIARWKSIIREASMQCGRVSLPVLEEIYHISDLCNIEWLKKSKKIFGYCGYGESIKSIFEDTLKYDSISAFIGPEGDFTEQEAKLLENNGWKSYKISDNILRSETAAVFFSILTMIKGEF